MYYKYGDQETPQSYIHFLHIRRAQQSASSVFKYLPNTYKTIRKKTTAVSKKTLEHFISPLLNNKYSILLSPVLRNIGCV